MIPAPAKISMRSTKRLLNIKELDRISRKSFPGYDTLNRLQSAVYPIACKTNKNMLICAPTGKDRCCYVDHSQSDLTARRSQS